MMEAGNWTIKSCTLEMKEKEGVILWTDICKIEKRHTFLAWSAATGAGWELNKVGGMASRLRDFPPNLPRLTTKLSFPIIHR